MHNIEISQYNFYDILYTFGFVGITHILLIIINKFSSKKLSKKAIWFFLHFVGNCLITLRAFDAIKLFLQDPIKIIMHADNVIDTRIIAFILHVYHPLFFKLNGDDLFHHIAFAYIGAIICHFLKGGYYYSINHIFITGIPGGIIYLCLVFEDLKLMTKTQRLHVASFVNVWIRSLGLSIGFAMPLIRIIATAKSFYDYIPLVIFWFFSIYNGQLYMDQVVRADEANKKASAQEKTVRTDEYNNVIQQIE